MAQPATPGKLSASEWEAAAGLAQKDLSAFADSDMFNVAVHASAGGSSQRGSARGQPLAVTVLPSNQDADFERDESTVRRSQADLSIILATFSGDACGMSRQDCNIEGPVPRESIVEYYRRLSTDLVKVWPLSKCASLHATWGKLFGASFHDDWSLVKCFNYLT